MKWNQSEIEVLSLILERIYTDLAPLEGKSILVLCSAGGEVALWLGERMKTGKVIGLELSPELLEISRHKARQSGLESTVEFDSAEKWHIPSESEQFDALVSEFILFPTPMPTEIGQPEMARVLKPGGKMLLTDVIAVKPLPGDLRAELESIGLDYLCQGCEDDFRRWMEKAGLINVEITDLTPIVRAAWQQRQASDPSTEHQKGYSLLLNHPEFGLGMGIFYIYIRGEKPQ